MIVIKLLNKEHELLDGALQNYFNDKDCNIKYDYLENDILKITIHLHSFGKNNFNYNDFHNNFKHVIV